MRIRNTGLLAVLWQWGRGISLQLSYACRMPFDAAYVPNENNEGQALSMKVVLPNFSRLSRARQVRTRSQCWKIWQIWTEVRVVSVWRLDSPIKRVQIGRKGLATKQISLTGYPATFLCCMMSNQFYLNIQRATIQNTSLNPNENKCRFCSLRTNWLIISSPSTVS